MLDTPLQEEKALNNFQTIIDNISEYIIPDTKAKPKSLPHFLAAKQNLNLNMHDWFEKVHFDSYNITDPPTNFKGVNYGS